MRNASKTSVEKYQYPELIIIYRFQGPTLTSVVYLQFIKQLQSLPTPEEKQLHKEENLDWT